MKWPWDTPLGWTPRLASKEEDWHHQAAPSREVLRLSRLAFTNQKGSPPDAQGTE